MKIQMDKKWNDMNSISLLLKIKELFNIKVQLYTCMTSTFSTKKKHQSNKHKCED